MTLDRERARELGKRSGAARRSLKLNLSRVEAAFGPLEAIQDAQRRLERLGVWAAAGLLTGSVAGAAVRSVEVWLKAHESRLTERVVEELSGELKRLKAELGTAKAAP